MHDFMKTIISALQTWISGKIKDSTADWNQNDSTKNNYVKNRPFYEAIEDIVIVPEQTITVEDGRANCEYNEVENMWNTGIEYTVIFDGISYTGTTYEDGDMCIHTDFVTNDGYEVYVYDYNGLIASDMTGEHTIQIILNNMSNVVKLDKKFLPNDTVLSVNGQTGNVYLRASDIGAVTTTQLNNKMDKSNPSGSGSFSMNRRSGTTIGNYSHAEGYNTVASGNYSHAEGYNTVASGNSSHAEGDTTIARCSNSHVQGRYNIYESNRYMIRKFNTSMIMFSQTYSYGDGYEIDENGVVSLINPKRYYIAQEVVGKWYLESGNLYKVICVLAMKKMRADMYTIVKEDYAYAHIVGNGDVNGRSNAHTLGWDGVGWYQGGLQVGGNAQDDEAKNVLLEGDALGIKSIQNIIPITPGVIAYGGKKFVAVNRNSAVYSYDGVNWIETIVPTIPNGISVKSIIYDNEKFVVTTDSDIVIYSKDGITWAQTFLPVSADWRLITYGNGKFVTISSTVGKNVAAYSYDGITWTQTTMPGDIYTQWLSVTYNGGKFVAIGAGYMTAYSYDGITWTQNTYPYPSYYSFNAYGNGRFILMGVTGINNIIYSDDGITWTQSSFPVNASWKSITYGNGKFVVKGSVSSTTSSGGTTYTDIILCSEDGITWTQTTFPVDQDWHSIIYGNGKFVAVGGDKGSGDYNGSDIAAYSEDGITWIQTTMPIKAEWGSTIYGNGRFVAFAGSDTQYRVTVYSEDGIIWHEAICNKLFQGNEDVTDEVRDLILDENYFPFATDDDILDTLSEMGYIDPISASDDSIYTNRNGEIYIL